MEIPQNIKELLNEIEGQHTLNELKQAAETLSADYRERERSGKTFVENELFAAAYILSRMPATCGAVDSALAESLRRYKKDIKTVLDVGAGTGAVAIATANHLRLDNITLVERQPEMLSLGKRVTEALKISAEWVNSDAAKLPDDNYDLVVTSYMLNELPKEKLKEYVSVLWQHTKGLLLIVDNGTPKGFSTVKAAAKILKGLGGNIIAPCPKVDGCPLPDDDWCHFTARIQRTKIHKALKGGEAPYEDEKFSYIAVARDKCDTCSARVLRHPKKESGKITLKLCTETGLETRLVTKRDKAQFKIARSLNAGNEY